MTAPYRYRPRTPTLLTQEGGGLMYTTSGQQAPESSYHLAVNMVPEDPRHITGQLRQRAGLTPLRSAGGVTGSYRASGTLLTADGITITWILTSTGIWTCDSGYVYTNVVTVADFAPVALFLNATAVYWCVFNNAVIFVPDLDTVANPFLWSVPIRWNGSAGSSSLTALTAANFCYGRPTVRSAKLFFIRHLNRDTIVWSEEADATTGYDFGGFSNIWTLGQTGTAPLYAILGTNDGLYYFRKQSIGVIRGEVNADFVTTSTHDALSQSIGLTGKTALDESNGAIWFTSAIGRPYILPFGGFPKAVAGVELGDPFDLYDMGIVSSDVRSVLAVPPLPWMPYETVWFAYGSSSAAGLSFLVCHAETGTPLAWFHPGSNAGGHETLILDPATNVTAVAVVSDAFATFTGHRGADLTQLGVAQPTDCVVIGRPLGTSNALRVTFERMAVQCGARLAMDVALAIATSDRPDGSVAMTPLTVTMPATINGRRVVGLAQQGRWVRPYLVATVSVDADVAFQWESWTVWAYPSDTDPAAL